MKVQLVLFSFIALTLRAELFEENQVSYAYDVEVHTDKSVIKYLVDTSYYERFSADVLGIYVLSSEVPMPILEYTHNMAQILNRFIELKTTTTNKDKDKDKQLMLRREFHKVLNINLFERFSKKYENHHPEIRDISYMLKGGDFNNIKYLYTSINDYIKRKKDFYSRQNNESAVEFCYDIEKTVLKPIKKIAYNMKKKPKVNNGDNFGDKAISNLNMIELKATWNEFKKYNLNVIEKFFENNMDKIYSVNDSNSLEVTLNEEESNNYFYYFICINIFGQNWYVELYDDYVSPIHRISLVRL